MKKIYGFLGAAALVALASCSNDKLDGPNVPDNGKDGYAYANFRITMAGGTRADNTNNLDQDFDEGTTDENAVKSLSVVFFNAQGYVSARGTATTFTTATTPSGTPNIDASVAVTLLEGSNLTDCKTVVAFVNYPSTVLVTGINSVNDVPNLVMEAAEVLGGDNTAVPSTGCPMTSSVYYNGSNAYVYLTDCDGYVYKKEENDLTTHPAVDIYVERVAAKVGVTGIKEIATFTNIFNKDGQPLTVTFDPSGWGVTTTAKATYGVKSMDDPSTESPDWFTTGSANKRTYWAVSGLAGSAGSWTSKYSTASATDFPVSSNVGAEEETPSYILDYTAGDTSLTGSFTTGTNVAYESSSNFYVLENTFDASVISALENPWAATTSVVVAGKYSVKNDGSEVTEFNDGFYLRQSTNGTRYLYTPVDAKATLIALATVINTGTPASHSALTDSDVTFGALSDPDVPAYLHYLQVTGSTTYVKNTAGEWATATAEEVNQFLKDFVGSCAFYSDMEGYYYVPLKHYVATTGNAAPSTGAYMSDIETGNYGIVRNNSYQLTINKISDFGIGKGGQPGEIFLPDPEVDNNYGLDATLHVLKWHLRNQSVDL